MVAQSYSSMVCYGRIYASVSDKAPIAPKCSEGQMASTSKPLVIRRRPGTANQCGVHFEAAYIEQKISSEIESYSNIEHHKDLKKAENTFRRVIKSYYDDVEIWLTGSFAAGVDIFTSDLDVTLKISSLTGANNFQKLHQIKALFRQNALFKNCKVIGGNTPVMKLVHVETGVEIDVTIDNDDAKRNTQLLSYYTQMDPRFTALCKAVKGWASQSKVEGAKHGRLNSFSICLMLIQYLQLMFVLPNIQALFPELNGPIEVKNDNYHKRNLKKELEERGYDFKRNTCSLAALYLGFMKFYAEFNFDTQWISVKNGRVIEKRWDSDEKPLDGLPDACRRIVVEDPFLTTPRNCAGSVRMNSFMERIQLEFQLTFNRILQEKKLFSMHPSVWRMKLDKNGKERDMQTIVWEQELFDYRLRNAPSEEELPWGSPLSRVPDYEFKIHPKKYWNLKQEPLFKYDKPLPWPEYIDMSAYERLDRF